MKTRQATRTVLNKIIETLDKLKEDGLLDEQEADRLHRVRESKSIQLFQYMNSLCLRITDPNFCKYFNKR